MSAINVISNGIVWSKVGHMDSTFSLYSAYVQRGLPKSHWTWLSLKHSKREQAVLFKEKNQENIAVYRKDTIWYIKWPALTHVL